MSWYNFEIIFFIKFDYLTRYTSVDFQLRIVAPLMFLVIYKFPRFAIPWNVLFILLGVFIAIFSRVFLDKPFLTELYNMESLLIGIDVFFTYHWRPEQHFLSYVLGIFCGYCIRHKPGLRFGGRTLQMFFWVTTSALTFGSMYWFNNLLLIDYDLTMTEVIVFLAIGKITFLSGWFWLFYACATGRGGIFTRFFSWKGFQIPSYLAFEVYVVSYLSWSF